MIVHLDNGWDKELFNWFFDELKKHNGKWDMIGMSLYPYWTRMEKPDYTADDIITDCMENIKALGAKYDCDVMIVETGMECGDDKGNRLSLPKANGSWNASSRKAGRIPEDAARVCSIGSRSASRTSIGWERLLPTAVLR